MCKFSSGCGSSDFVFAKTVKSNYANNAADPLLQEIHHHQVIVLNVVIAKKNFR